MADFSVFYSLHIYCLCPSTYRSPDEIYVLDSSCNVTPNLSAHEGAPPKATWLDHDGICSIHRPRQEGSLATVGAGIYAERSCYSNG